MGLTHMATGYVYDLHYLEHDLAGHPENTGRLRAIMSHLQESGLLEQLTPIAPAPVGTALLYEVHAEGYCRRVQRIAGAGGGFLDADTYVTPRSYDVPLLAAGGVL